MRSHRTPIVLAALALLVPLALTACGGPEEADLYAYGQRAGEPGSAPMLVDTSAVLFPLHPRYAHGMETAKLRFYFNLEDITPFTAVTREPTTVRVGPGSLYEVATVLVTGTELVLDGQVGPWYRISDNRGYVLALQLEDIYPVGIAWQVSVTGEGSHEKVDECLPGVTHFDEIAEDHGRPYYAMHSYCGGEPIALLDVGALVMIDEVTYRVDSVNERLLFGDSAMLAGIDADAYLHTCNLLGDVAIILGLKSERGLP